MNAAAFLNKPTYWFRPYQAFSRLAHTPAGLEDVKLAWGTTITCNTTENIGRLILHHGVYDLVVSEAIWRLLPVGGFAVDVGANIGHMSGLMAKRAGPNGRVTSFEPSSRIRTTLARNVARWASDPRFAPISVNSAALSDSEGTVTLYYPPNVFSANEGTASLDQTWAGGHAIESEAVSMTTLDAALEAETRPIDVLKIDVEGHELGVLQGSTGLLRKRQARHIIFEGFEPYPSPVHQLLETFGYKVCRLARRFFRVDAIHPADRTVYPVDVMPNYLATIEPQTIARAFSRWGWRALRHSSR